LSNLEPGPGDGIARLRLSHSRVKPPRLVLCVASFWGLAPVADPKNPEAQPVADTPGPLVSGFAPAAWMLLLAWPALTILGLAAWPLGSALAAVGVHGTALKFGSLPLLNLGVVGLGTLVAAIAVQPGDLSRRNFAPRRLKDDASMAVLFGVLVAIGVLALFLGHGPAINWLGSL
jgi:hypothetical protein